MMNDANQNIQLGKVAKITTGYQFRGAATLLAPGATTYVQLKNVHPEKGIDWSEAMRVAIPEMHGTRYLQDGDIIFSARGARNIAYLVENAPALAVCAPHFFVLRIHDQSQLLPAFLTWQINQAPAQAYLNGCAEGSNLRNVRRPILADMPITIPKVERQQQISDFWKAAMAEQSLLLRLIENRKQQLKAIAQNLVVGRTKTQ